MHFSAGAGAERSANFKKKLGAGVEPESDFKVVFEIVMIVGGRMSHYFCSLEMEYQNMWLRLAYLRLLSNITTASNFLSKRIFVRSISERSVAVKFWSRIGAGVS